MPPHFRPALAPVSWDKDALRWPGPVGSGFLSPQPPGIAGIGLSQRVDWTNASWSILFLGFDS